MDNRRDNELASGRAETSVSQVGSCKRFQSLQALLAAPGSLKEWGQAASQLGIQGHLPDYIPLLATADPTWFAVSIRTLTGEAQAWGDCDRAIVLMSIIKPFVLLYLLEQFGSDRVFQWVGCQPSEHPFYSLNQLQMDQGFPRNPMINSGALALSGRLPGKSAADRCNQLCQWLNQQAEVALSLDKSMLASVEGLSNETNYAIAQCLAQSGHLRDVDLAIATYNRICCLAGTVDDIARLGLLLVSESIQALHRRAVNALMLTCGLYEVSGPYAVRIGLPMKSGVSGLILAIVPQQGAIVCYSPALDTTGNSIGGLAFVEQLAQRCSLGPF